MLSGLKFQPVEFGRLLVETGDLDPVYVMVRGAHLPLAVRRRWVLGYWLFYHVGVAARLAEAPSFWAGVEQGLRERWPRGTERRHFRGMQAGTLVAWLRTRYPDPEQAVAFISGPPGGAARFKDVRERALSWWGFGPWIAFKMCDMTDALLDVHVDFTDTEADWFSAPKDGAAALLLDTGRGRAPADHVSVRRAVDEVLAPALGSLTAPHADRPLRAQEYETILCKYKAHRIGRYPVGFDTHHVQKALRWANTPLTGVFRATAPSLVGGVAA